MITREQIWTSLTLVLAASSLAIVILDVTHPLRAAIVLGFVLVCPGMAMVRLLRIGKPWIDLFLAIVVSLAFAAVVAALLVYVGLWNPKIGMVVLVAATLAAIMADLVRPDP